MPTSVEPRELLEETVEHLGYSSAEGFVRSTSRIPPSARSFVWRELRRKAGVASAYFRGGVPLIAFAHASSTREIEHLHRRLWNLSRVPILLAATPEEIAAYSCFIGPGPHGELSDALLQRTTPGTPEVLQEFSRFHVESGSVATRYRPKFKRSARVDRHLLDNLRALRKRLSGEDERRRAVDQLIGRSIFIRYFEDRGILSAEHLQELTPHNSYLEVLKSGVQPTYSLFRALALRFNGDVFSVGPDESRVMTSEDLHTISAFFAGMDTATGQQALWPYDFSVIPPELISAIYEQLLEEDQKKDAAYYTPRTVVDLVLDETLPWGAPPVATRLLDPACGSGIFLAEAFRRKVFQAQQSRSKKARLSFEELSALLTASIFGVDKNPSAVSVAALALYLALLEELEPPIVWERARLPRLVGRNLVVSDFFDPNPLSEQRFDLVVGNPPWKSQLSASAARYVERAGHVVPDQQLALVFLLRAGELLSPGGRIGLVLPAKALLHNKSDTSLALRRDVMARFSLETVIDLSILRKGTFSKATAPAVVVVARLSTEATLIAAERGAELQVHPDARKDSAETGSIVHVVPRDSPLQRTLDGFVVSQDDIHLVSQSLATSAPDIWKVLLWGSMRDWDLVARLRANFTALGDIAREHGWVHGQGFQVKGGDKNDASQLLGLPFVPTKSIHPFYVVPSPERVHDRVMHRPRDRRLYEAPHLLIRRGLVRGRPAAAFLAEAAAFNNGIFGIAAPRRDDQLLRLICAFINSSLGSYYQFMTSSSWGVEREFIEENEYLSMPVAVPGNAVLARILDAARRLESEAPATAGHTAASSSEELDEAVFDAYALGDQDRDRIRDALTTLIDQFDHPTASAAFKPPSEPALASYVARLQELLGESVPSLTVNAWVSEASTAYMVANVRFIERGGAASDNTAPLAGDVVGSLIRQAEAIVQERPSPATVVQPTLLLFSGSEVHLLKPKELRYWTLSSALDDASEILGGVAGRAR